MVRGGLLSAACPYNDPSTTRKKVARMSKNKTNKAGSSSIAQNKKARHEYFIEDRFEAGLELQGWEVKSLRAGKVNLRL